jgi:hypothetical protein
MNARPHTINAQALSVRPMRRQRPTSGRGGRGGGGGCWDGGNQYGGGDGCATRG